MERPTRSRVRHGTPSCARYGCKEDACLQAQRREHREGYRRLRQGIRMEVDAAPARAHLQALVEREMPPVDIADRSGVPVVTVRQVLRGAQRRIHRYTEEDLLGVPIPVDRWIPAGDTLVCPVGTARRLQALAVQGFPISAIAEQTSQSGRWLGQVRSGRRERILLSTKIAVEAVHDLLWDADPREWVAQASAVTRARQWAQRQGWHPTEAWSDIDDPDCRPSGSMPRYLVVAEDAEELMRVQGYDRRGAAERLGVSRDYLDSALSRARRLAA